MSEQECECARRRDEVFEKHCGRQGEKYKRKKEWGWRRTSD